MDNEREMPLTYLLAIRHFWRTSGLLPLFATLPPIRPSIFASPPYGVPVQLTTHFKWAVSGQPLNSSFFISQPTYLLDDK